MPRTPHPRDWDRYFGPRAQRRRGPLGLLSFTTLAGVMLAALIIFGNVGVKAYTTQNEVRARLTITPLWATAYARKTAAALAESSQAQPTPTAAAQLQLAQLRTEGNLRAEPRIAPGNVLGQLPSGTEVAVLSAQPLGNPQWYHVRTIKTGSLKVGTEGWISATIITVASAQPASATVVPSAMSSAAGSALSQ